MIESFTINDLELKVEACDSSDAIRKAAQPLLARSCITPNYILEMLDVYSELGPYFVLAPGVAIAHSRPSESVLETGISIITLSNPVVFGNKENDPVEIVCVIASKSPNEHIEMLRKLVAFLGNDGLKNQLLTASTQEDRDKIVSKLNSL